MAQKRMFDKAIIRNDKFLDMPPSTQNLYFHLGMEADDEGFVSPKMIMRTVGANDDELKVLVAKKLVIPFESGVIVITDWRDNNWLDSRRIKPTQYQEEKAQLSLENNKYLLCKNPLSKKLHTLSQSSIEESRVEQKRVEKSYELPSWIKPETWEEWLEYRKARKLPKYTAIGVKKLFTQLANETGSNNEKLQIGIDFSIAKNYQGIYYPKGDYKKEVTNVLVTQDREDILTAFKRK